MGSNGTMGTTGNMGTGAGGSGGTQGTGDGSTGGGMGGGTSGGSCTADMLQLTITSGGNHDHLPLSTEEQMQFVMLINEGGGGMVTWAGGDPHSHTLTFTADEVMTLANGGTLEGKESSTDMMHSHTYTITCA